LQYDKTTPIGAVGKYVIEQSLSVGV